MKWEYKLIHRSRSWEKGHATEWYRDIAKELEALGNDGWELIVVEPISSHLGGHAEGNQWYNYCNDFAGFTSDELWVFKRPKP